MPARRLIASCALALGVSLALLSGVAQAATITVDAPYDTSASQCTLRDAIDSANSDTAAGFCSTGSGPDTIDFNPSTHPGGSLIGLLTPLPSIASPIDIVGPAGGLELVRVTAIAPHFRIFHVTSGTQASMSHLIVSHGNADGANGSGIWNEGTLDLDHVTVEHNDTSGCTVTGGGIYNSGTLSLTDSTVQINQATASCFGLGGGIVNASQLTLTRSTVYANFLIVQDAGASGFAWGGGILNGAGATTNLVDSTVEGNYAGVGGNTTSADAEGGGIWNNGTLTASGSTFDLNAVTAGATGGPGSVAKTYGGALALLAGSSTTMRSSTVTDNQIATSTALSTTERGQEIGAVSATPSLSLLGSTVDGSGTTAGFEIQGPMNLTMKSSIVQKGPFPSASTDCSGLSSVTSQGYNLDGDGTCISSPATGDQEGTVGTPIDPQLGGLADHGGPTKTQAIPNTSPALDAGLALPATSVDQRGKTRPADLPEVANASGGDGTDIGAFEYQPSADLSVTQVDDADPVHFGDQITYTATVTNNGPDSAAGTTVTDTLPAGTSFVSASPSCSPPVAGVVTCALGLVASGAAPSVQITVSTDAPGAPSNQADVSASTADPDSNNDSSAEATEVRGLADLSIVQTGPSAPVTVGDSVTYAIHVDNAGPNDAQSVAVTDTLPSGLTFASGSTGCSPAGSVVTCSVGTLASGGSAALSVTATAAAPGDQSNIAAVDSATDDSNPANNSATLLTGVVPKPTVAVGPNPRCTTLRAKVKKTKGKRAKRKLRGKLRGLGC